MIATTFRWIMTYTAYLGLFLQKGVYQAGSTHVPGVNSIYFLLSCFRSINHAAFVSFIYFILNLKQGYSEEYFHQIFFLFWLKFRFFFRRLSLYCQRYCSCLKKAIVSARKHMQMFCASVWREHLQSGYLMEF